MVDDQCPAGNVILKRTGENIRYCQVIDIEAIAQEVLCEYLFMDTKLNYLFVCFTLSCSQEQHCVLLIEPSQLKNTSLSKLHPIVIFLHTNKPNHLSKYVKLSI